MSQLLWDARWNASFSEITGVYQIRILANNPKQILHELMRKSSGTHEAPLWRNFAHDLGEAISFSDNNLFDPELYDTTHIQLRSYDDLVQIVQSASRSKSERLFCDRFLRAIKDAWKQADARNAPSFEQFELDSSEVYVVLSPKIFPIVPSLGDLHIQKEGRKPNFAGHFIVANYVDCGTCCETYRIVDSRTGKVYDAPTFTVSDACGVIKEMTVQGPRAEYHLNSTLIVFRGSLDEKGFGTYYYNWKHGLLILVDAVEDWLVSYSKTRNKTK